MTPAPRLSVVISTCNRRDLLARALGGLLAQRDAPPHEILVIDNRSTDGTRDLVERLAGENDGRLGYRFEGMQGLSHARNAGVAAARAPIVAFTDDDVWVEPGWMAAIETAFLRQPAAWYVGGRVLPDWNQPPAWLTPAHWSPLALQDHGPVSFEVGPERPLCLVGANLAFRAEVFREVGLFSPDVQLLPGAVGSTEDHELMIRVWRRGGRGVYDPSIVVRTHVQAERLTRRYHRRWHYAHGRSHARMRLPEMERSRARLLGVPSHLFRQAGADLLDRIRPGSAASAFGAEARLCFFAGFVRERLLAGARASHPAPPASLQLLPPAPLVSVVIPCYNQAPYLGEAIGSALAQSHRPVEVIVVDDGSRDETAEVAAGYHGVTLVRQRNRGLAHARNAGLAASRGGCVVFLDADDRLAPDAIARGVQALAAHPEAALAFGRARVIDDHGAPVFTAPASAVSLPDDGYAGLLASNKIWTPAVAIFRREAVDESGAFDPTVDAAADYDLYLRTTRRYRVVSHGHVVADYRHHDAAMSRRAARMLRATLAAHRRQWRHARHDPTRRRAYHEGRQFWQAFFGDQLMDEVRAGLGAGGRPIRSFAGLITMARRAPRRLAWHVRRWLRHSIARRPAATIQQVTPVSRRDAPSDSSRSARQP